MKPSNRATRTGDRTWTDQRFEEVIGQLLRAGVLVAALIVLIAGAITLARHEHQTRSYTVFHAEPPAYSTLRGVLTPSTLRTGTGWIMLGILVLFLTPISRVAFSLLAFALQRDWMYVVFTTMVLGILLYSLLHPPAAREITPAL